MKKQFMIAAAFAAAGAASAATVVVNSDITVSETWVATNEYELAQQIYVRPGATLTIEAGTTVRSGGEFVDGGSLAVLRGAKIFVNGTKDNPVTMTSWNDTNSTWMATANEWGNLTIMGEGLISDSFTAGNTAAPTGLNEAQMEGLTDLVAKYGGDNDYDCSGSISHLSIRYGGKVIGLGNELNGLSLGGIGRCTDIDHVEIMNNVDDGIEIWGGTVNLKYVSIWNVGDDSLDCDQGWRGKAQFGLIVQGYSLTNKKQGSGIGDNCIEIDGAEDADAKPVTTTKIANFTVIGQPAGGDGATTWRDNARVQYKNCIFMDIGEEIVRLDRMDGDGSQGYGSLGTPSWSSLWQTSYDVYPTLNHTNLVYASIEDMYQAQSSGNLCELEGCLIFGYPGDSADFAFGTNLVNFTNGDKIADSDFAVGAFNGDYNNPQSNVTLDNVVAVSSPVVAVERGPVVIVGPGGSDNKAMLPVTNLNPLAQNDALTVASSVEEDGFFCDAPYRGAFRHHNWLAGWTAADEFGMTDTSGNEIVAAIDQGTGVVVSFQSEAGVNYAIYASDNVASNFVEVGTVAGNGSVISYGDLALEDAQFYKVVAQ